MSTLQCSHEPKFSIKRGLTNNELYEIWVCERCRNDPDLKNFEEITL